MREKKMEKVCCCCCCCCCCCNCCRLGSVPSYSFSQSADWPCFLHTHTTDRALPSQALLHPCEPNLVVTNMEAAGFFETSEHSSSTRRRHPAADRQPINLRPERLRAQKEMLTMWGANDGSRGIRCVAWLLC